MISLIFIILLIAAGLMLLAVEILLIPGIGAAGILGALSLTGSCWIAFRQFGPQGGLTAIAVDLLLIILGIVFLLRTGIWEKIGLRTRINARVSEPPARIGIEPGQKGITLTRLAPAGQARIGTQTAEVFTRDAIIEPGREIEVTEIDGHRIFVGLPKNEKNNQNPE